MLHVLLGKAGQVGAQNVLAVGLDEVHRGDPAAHGGAMAVALRSLEEGVEQPVHLVLDRAQLADRLPANQCHLLCPSLCDY